MTYGLTEAHVAVMRKTLEHVLAHPDEHEQGSWGWSYDLTDERVSSDVPACGTSFCFAGHAAVTVAGATPLWEEGEFGMLTVVVPPGVPVTDVDQHHDVAIYAAEVLGLQPDDSGFLFAGTNTLVDLAELVYDYTDDRVDLRAEARVVQDRVDARRRARLYRPLRRDDA